MGIIEQTPERLVIHDSPWGIRGMGLIFAIAGFGIVCLIFGGGHSSEHNAWVAYVVGGGFGIVGLALVLTATDLTVVFEAATKTATMTQRGLFGTKTTEVPYASIRDIALEMQTGIGTSNRSGPTYRVVFVLKDGTRTPWTSLLTSDMGNQAKCVAAARSFGGWDTPAANAANAAAGGTPATGVTRRTPVYLNGVLSAATPNSGVKNVALLAAFMGVFCLVGAVLMVMQVERLASWKPVQATVLSTRIDAVRGSKGGVSYRPVVNYTYNVNGRPFTSNSVSVISVSQSYAWASSIVARYQPGAQVTAYVNPHNPRGAYLVHELSLLPLIIMFIPLAVGAMIYYSARWSSRQAAVATAANVPVLPAIPSAPLRAA
jgi:hypothetical protein